MLIKLANQMNEYFHFDNSKVIICEMLNDFKIEDIYLILKNNLILNSYKNIHDYSDVILRIISDGDTLFDNKECMYRYIEKCDEKYLEKEGWKIYGEVAFYIDLKGLSKVKPNNKDFLYKRYNYLSGRCIIEGCNKKIYTNGLCKHHYFAERTKINLNNSKDRKKNACSYKSCYEKVFSGGLCERHYNEFLEGLGREK